VGGGRRRSKQPVDHRSGSHDAESIDLPFALSGDGDAGKLTAAN
jgi:hypothetical protein